MIANSDTREDSIDPQHLVAGLRRAFDSGRTRPLDWRRAQIRGLEAFLVEEEQAILAALAADLGKPRFEGFSSDVAFVRAECRFVLRRLRRWVAPRRVATPLILQPGRSRVVPEPLGVVLILGAWNYPVQLALAPLLGALAAGNCAVVKPSEVAARTSALLAERLGKRLDGECVRVVEGGVAETTGLLAQRFDHVFYTGNGTVGRIVMQAAARHLTPVTLELGGKSPCYVDRGADLDVAARRIAWGRFFNAGQTCVAPDYVLVHRDALDGLLARLADSIRAFYGPDPRRSPDFGRIVSDRHFERLCALLAGGGSIHTGGERDAGERYLAPTVLHPVAPDAAVLQEEIFGPILPVLAVRDAEEAISYVAARPRPLAEYVFTRDRRVAQAFVDRTSAGGVCVNHVLMHAANPHLPFGGVGDSGMGAYHGERSFTTFSHLKPVLERPTWFDPRAIYPPYDEKKLALVRRFGC